MTPSHKTPPLYMCMCVYSAFGSECEFMILVKIIYALNKS